MQIVHESRDSLILKERAVALRAIGTALCVAGIVMLVAIARAHGPSVGLYIAGGITATLGALLALFPATHTFAFSRQERRLVVVRQRFGHARREEYPLREVANACVEASRSDEGGDAWRVVVELADGRIIPVTSYYSSGYNGKRRDAHRMREFLKRAGDRASDAPRHPRDASSPHAINLTTPRNKLGAAALLGLFGLVFGGIGGTNMLREHQRLTTWRPVEATILSKHVDEHSDSDGSTYSPVVVYRYYVNDRPYTSSRVLPVSESRSGGWAHRIVAQYELNGTYTAWYDPAAPAEAYLRRARSVVASIFTAIGAALLVAAIAVARRTSRH